MSKTNRSCVDVSVLGIDAEELAEMSAEDRVSELRDALNRAADLLVELSSAFAKELGTQRADVIEASREVVRVARAVQS